MESENKPFSGYDSGAEMWRDTASSYGIDEAVCICRNYLGMNLKRKLADDERQFCREFFAAWHEATANKIDPAKLVYAYDYKTADDRGESAYYHKSRQLNTDCARGIDEIIHASRYETDHYNFEIAAMKAVMDYGFTRVNLVLAFNIGRRIADARYSSANRIWANSFTMPERAFDCAWLQAHAILVDGFSGYIRELYANLGAERFALPGNEERGEPKPVHDYEIMRSIMIDENQGYAIGHNPAVVSPWVCWQFYLREGERGYNWGIYGEEQNAIDAYNSRVFVAFN